MQVIHSIQALREERERYRRDGKQVVLVPTMGALHEAHLRLVDDARRHGNLVVASVFVNPMQFGPDEDFDAYPRDLQADSRLLAERGADLLFAPPVDAVYPDGPGLETRIDVGTLAAILCGRARPGHFAGVATVVAKLFNLVQPQAAVFGEKDYQQLMVIRRMVRDLNFPVAVVGVPTVRHADGLAMSSRNAYLTATERAVAPSLYRQLQQAATAVEAGAEPQQVERATTAALREAGFRPDYVQVLRAQDLASPTDADGDLVVLAAAWLGRARLIDNLCFRRSPLAVPRV